VPPIVLYVKLDINAPQFTTMNFALQTHGHCQAQQNAPCHVLRALCVQETARWNAQYADQINTQSDLAVKMEIPYATLLVIQGCLAHFIRMDFAVNVPSELTCHIMELAHAHLVQKANMPM